MLPFLLALCPLVPLAFIALHTLLRRHHAGWAAATQSLFGLLLCALALPAFLPGSERVAFEAATVRLHSAEMSLRIALYLDARNAAFVLLLGLCLPLVFNLIRPRSEVSRSYYICANILIASMLGVFTADGLLLFYFFWEMALIGAYFWIGLHGVARAEVSSVYGALMRFVLITLLGSLPMLLSIALIILGSGDVGLAGLGDAVANLSPAHRSWAFVGFLLGFGVKLPLLGLHGWLRDTYAVAPAPCRALLSALMSKMGAYGLLLILVPAFPSEMAHWQVALLGLASAGVIYGALVCLARKDFLSVLTYSSLAHLSLVALGAFAGARGDAADASAITAGVFQVFNHGLIMALLFALEDRISVDGVSLHMGQVSGLRAGQSRLAALMLVSLFASASLPGLSNFAGELMLYFAAFRISPWYTFAAGLGALITAAALIRAFHHLFMGTRRGEVTQDRDLRSSEMIVGLAVVAVWLVLGFYPMLFVGPVEKAFAVAVAGVAP